MEFANKLQELRKNKGITQDELASALFVTRAAVSKWESGRGYPNIGSLKDIALYFGVTVDSLLSGDAVLDLAQQEQKQKAEGITRLLFCTVDLCSFLLLFLPLFGENTGGAVISSPLFLLTSIAGYIKGLYSACIVSVVLCGFLGCIYFSRHIKTVSVALHIATVLVFILSRQAYAAALTFILLAIKAVILIRNK